MGGQNLGDPKCTNYQKMLIIGTINKVSNARNLGYKGRRGEVM
jgi:hypothetical protein